MLVLLVRIQIQIEIQIGFDFDNDFRFADFDLYVTEKGLLGAVDESPCPRVPVSPREIIRPARATCKNPQIITDERRS